MSALLDLLGYSDRKYLSDTVQSKYRPLGTVAKATHPDPRWALNPTEVDKMPNPVLHPLPIDLVKSELKSFGSTGIPRKSREGQPPRFPEKLLKELEQHQNSGDIDAYKKSVITLYAGTKEHEREVNRKSSAREAFHRVTPLHDEFLGRRHFNVEDHELAHVVLSSPKFTKAYQEVDDRRWEAYKRNSVFAYLNALDGPPRRIMDHKGLPFINHNLEEAVIRHMEQAPDIKSILKDYAAIGMPIINDPNIWKNSDPTLSIADSAAGNKRLNAIAGLMYDHVSGPEGRSPYWKYGAKEKSREEAVAHIAYRAERLHRAVGEVLENIPLVVKEIESKEAVQKFAEGGLVGNNLKKTSGKGLSSLVEASPDYELSPIGLGSMTQQAQKLAEYGRNGDVYIVHAAEGETVIPMEILDANPQLKALLYGQIEEMGLDPNEFVVGNELNSINPATGLPEFFFKKLFRGVKNAVKKVVGFAKKIAPIALPIAAQAFGIPGLSSIPGVGQYFGAGSIGAAALGGGLGSLIGGQDPLKGALLSGAASGVLGGGLTSDIPFSQAASNFMSAPDRFDYLKSAIAPRFFGPGRALSETAAASGASVSPDSYGTLPPGQIVKQVNLSGTDPVGVAAGDGEGFTIGKFLKDNWGKIGIGLGAAYLAGAFDPAEQPQLEDLVGPNLDEPIKSPQHYDPTWPVWQHSPTVSVADGGFLEEFPRRELLVEGPGTEKSDDIPAMLSDGEFVWNSAAVRGADPTGNNNRYAGASALYDMMRKFEMNGTQKPAQGFV